MYFGFLVSLFPNHLSRSHPNREFLENYLLERYFGYSFLQNKQMDIQSLTISKKINYPQIGASITVDL